MDDFKPTPNSPTSSTQVSQPAPQNLAHADNNSIKQIDQKEPPFIEQVQSKPSVVSTLQTSNTPVNQSDQGVTINNKEFVEEKLTLDPNAQAVFNQAVQASEPEKVFDQVEMDKDKKLAQELIQKAGLSPNLVQKALNEKMGHIQEQNSSTVPQAVSRVTTEEAKTVLGSEEYQKEAQVDQQKQGNIGK